MSYRNKIKQILTEEQILLNEPMKKHTTFRVGGPADIYVRPDFKQLPSLIQLLTSENIPYFIIGNGSNLLVGDKGIRGVVIELGKNIQGIEQSENKIHVKAGTLLSKTAAYAAKNGLAGMEFASGIPGTIGGAIVMNAGAYGGEMKDIVTSVEVLTKYGELKMLSNEELAFSYRQSSILNQEYIVLSVEMGLKSGELTEINERMDELKKQRTLKQPLEFPSAGSTFKRPEGYFAGKLIMDCGLSGYQVGGAQVSKKHCGFVINRNEATAYDLCKLVEDVKEKVLQEYGVLLETEVKFVGEF